MTRAPTFQRHYLIEFIPDGIEVLFDGVAAEGDPRHTDLNIGVALPLHYAPHEVVLGYKVLRLHQMDTQHSLLGKPRTGNVIVVGVCVCVCVLTPRSCFSPLLQNLGQGWYAGVAQAEVYPTRRAPRLPDLMCFPPDPSQSQGQKDEETEL